MRDIGTEIEQTLHGLDMATLGCPDQRGPATTELDLIDPGIGEAPHHVTVDIARGKHQGRVVALFVQIDPRPRCQQTGNRVAAAELRSQHQWGAITDVTLIDLTGFERPHQVLGLTLLGQFVHLGTGSGPLAMLVAESAGSAALQ